MQRLTSIAQIPSTYVNCRCNIPRAVQWKVPNSWPLTAASRNRCLEQPNCGGRERSHASGGANEAEVSDACRRDHCSAELQCLRPAGREARQAEFSHLLRSQVAGRVRAWRRDDPFVLVPDRTPDIRGSANGKSVRRDREATSPCSSA